MHLSDLALVLPLASARAPATLLAGATAPDLAAALFGGALIGLASMLLLLFSGRVAGISGVVGGLLPPRLGDLDWRVGFVAGLLVGGLALRLALPSTLDLSTLPDSTPLLLLGGALVGVGTRMGNGCTSGHGVCG
ncbi:MAG: hypothetical protein KC468_31685, partial [Myxococcales bacterium]|nr:hypothetical protein [Myxococcales bacterium]